MRRGIALAACLLALAASPALGQSALSGPDGTSLDKVLVIGIDGTRWDLLTAAMRDGRAANLARLRREGFGRPSRLEFGPGTLTLSEVGWSSIASGVWEDKHGVDGTMLNMDPGQATKNGHHDFLTRIERARPRLSTFIASDWDNLGLPVNGGPIFGTAMDANFAHRVPSETLENWNRGDIEVTRAATRYLRSGNPDAGFVYLGLVDETAHLVGSATPAYATSIGTTDRRIGQLLRAVRGRPTYAFESWTILVTTDHGERPLTEPSVIAHFGDTPLERTVFVIGDGPGLGASVRKPRVVDILPTVLHQLGLRTNPGWRIDGRSLSSARQPSSSASATLRRGRLAARLKLGAGPRGVKSATFRLPAGAGAETAAARRNGAPAAVTVAARVNGAPAAVTVAGRNLVVRVRARRLRTLSLEASVPGSRGGKLTVTLRGGGRKLGVLAVPL